MTTSPPPDPDAHESGPAESVDGRSEDAVVPPEVVALRKLADEHALLLGPSIDAQIEPVLRNCRIALQALADKHGHLADCTDLDLRGDTRWAARWQLAGAAIAYANALVDLSERGHVDASLPVARTLHEALGVLGVVNDDAEKTILRRWLDDCEVEPKKVRAAAERQARRVSEAAAAQGVVINVDGIKEQMELMYGLLCDVSHTRRSGLRGMVNPELRRAVYGRHPDPIERLGGAASTVLAIEATILGVGDVLAAFYGGPYYREVIKPIQDGLMASSAQLMALTGDPSAAGPS